MKPAAFARATKIANLLAFANGLDFEHRVRYFTRLCQL